MTGEVFVQMWCCQDEVCDCTRPEVFVREQEYHGAPWRVRLIAEGPFLSYGYGSPEPEEIRAQKKWFYAAKHWYHQHKSQQPAPQRQEESR